MFEKDNAPPKARLKIIPVLVMASFIIIQILAIFLLLRYFQFIEITISSWLVVSLAFAVCIVNTDEDSNIRISWVLLALVFPVFGLLLYIFLHLCRVGGQFRLIEGEKKCQAL